MGKKSNGKLREARHAERVVRKGLDQVAPDPYSTARNVRRREPTPSDSYAYVYGSNGVHLTQRG